MRYLLLFLLLIGCNQKLKDYEKPKLETKGTFSTRWEDDAAFENRYLDLVEEYKSIIITGRATPEAFKKKLIRLEIMLQMRRDEKEILILQRGIEIEKSKLKD